MGILKQLKDEMSADLADAQKAEADRKANHAAVVAAKENEVASLTEAIEAKLTRQGELDVQVKSMNGDLSETQRFLLADQELVAKLAENFGSQTLEWRERQKSRAEELVARIEAVHKSISELDDSVAKATEIRQKQHSEFVTLTANNAAATQLLKFANNRLAIPLPLFQTRSFEFGSLVSN